MTRIYGRRFPNLENTENYSANNSIIGHDYTLICRTLLDRPSNEDRIRGIC